MITLCLCTVIVLVGSFLGTRLAKPANALIVRTLITRDYIPLDFLHGVTGIPFFALSRTLKEIGALDASSARTRFHSSALVV
jgi:hypothetical protein